MSVKKLDIASIGNVTLYKRRGVRNIRLGIASDGTVRVTLPAWAPYRLGVEFVRTKQVWIASHRPQPQQALRDGDRIGFSHLLLFQLHDGETSSRITGNEIRVKYPASLTIQDKVVQAAAERGSIRALKNQAESVLPGRLRLLASEHRFTFKSVTIKRLKSRWGSCDSHGNITLNLFLMQLPEVLIDYVLLHELVHTKVLRHGPPFWQTMQAVLPNTRELRQDIRQYQPQLRSHESETEGTESDGPQLRTLDS